MVRDCPVGGASAQSTQTPTEAFTFTLINVHTDPDIVATEMSVMDDVYRVVRDDGRDEDDVIILGDFNADDAHLGELGQVPGITWAISARTFALFSSTSFA